MKDKGRCYCSPPYSESGWGQSSKRR